MLAQRKALAGEERKELEGLIRRNILTIPGFENMDTIALYVPVHGEVDLLFMCRETTRSLLFPRVEGDMLAFYPARSKDDFISGFKGIPEPSGKEPVMIRDIDMILVPGIVFDENGYRLGYGKGYYDRLISRYPDVLTAGVCFDNFFIERLPVDPWDSRVDLVVTQTRVFKTEGEV